MPGTLNTQLKRSDTKSPASEELKEASDAHMAESEQDTSDPPASSPPPKVAQKRPWDQANGRDDRFDSQHSPPRLNRTFQRDRERSPPEGRGPIQSSPGRGYRRADDHPHARHQHSDRYVPRSPSPPRRRQTFDRRGQEPAYSPDCHGLTSPYRARASHSGAHDDLKDGIVSPSRVRRLSSNTKRPTFHNRTWTNPQVHRKTSADVWAEATKAVSAHAPPDGSAQAVVRSKVDFNGLKDVPTGPKPGNTPMASERPSDQDWPGPKILPLPDVSISVRAAPHIFISSISVPPHPATLPHLQGFVQRHQPEYLDLDDNGYYVVFAETPQGRHRLDACMLTKNRKQLFSQYIVVMEAYPDGQPPSERGDTTGPAQDPGQGSQDPSLNERQSYGLENNHDHSAEAASGVSTANGLVRDGIQRSSSPLRIPSRQDGDDASVVSGKTSSSGRSTSTRLRCHVCKTASSLDADALVHCSTCPRRYHRRCHESPDIPPQREIDSQPWQCKRCVNKQIAAPPPRFAEKISSEAGSPVHDLVDKVERPTKKAKFQHDGEGHRSAGLKPATLATLIAAGGSDTLSAAASAIAQKVGGVEPAESVGNEEPDLPPQSRPKMPASNDLHLDEADRLVEDSFIAGARAPPDALKKNGKPNLTRKKLPQAVQAAPQPPSAMPIQMLLPAAERTTSPPAPMRHAGSGRQAASGDRNTSHNIFEVPESPEVKLDTRVQRAQEVARRLSTMPGDVVNRSREKKEGKSLGSPSPVDSVVQVDGATRAIAQRPQATAKKTKAIWVPCSVCKKAKVSVPVTSRGALCPGCRKIKAAEEASAVPEERDADDPDEAPMVERPSGDTIAKLDRDRVLGDVQPPPDVATTARDHTRLTDLSLEAPDESANFWQVVPDHASVKEVPGRHAKQDIEPLEHGRRRIDKDPVSDGDTEDVDQSDDLSTPPPDLSARSSETPNTPDQAIGTGKRRRRDKASFTSPGCLSQRPDCYVEALCRFALCEAPNHRLQARSISLWIAQNIPGYIMGEDRWEHTVSMTLSHYDGKNKGVWSHEDLKPGDKGANGKGRWYVLNPGVADESQRWDPVLKQPVSPPRAWRNSSSGEDDASEDEAPVRPRRAGKQGLAEHQKPQFAAIKSTAAQQLPDKRAKSARAAFEGTTKLEADDHMQSEPPDDGVPNEEAATEQNNDLLDEAGSSDDVPLANLRRSKTTRSTAPTATTLRSPSGRRHRGRPATESNDAPKLVAGDTDDSMTICEPGNGAVTPKAVATTAAMKRLPFSRPLSANVRATNGSLADLIKIEAEDIDYTATSLFDEWPEVDPSKSFNQHEKLTEIRARRSRKSMFGQSAMFSRLGIDDHVASEASMTQNEPPPQSATKSPKKQRYYDFPPLEEHVQEYDTVEEFFALPENPLPLIRSKVLAFREGTKPDGKRRRAAVYYHTGYED